MIIKSKRPKNFAGRLSITPENFTDQYDFIKQSSVNYLNVGTIKGWDPGVYSLQINTAAPKPPPVTNDFVADLINTGAIGAIDIAVCYTEE